jgi:hypothetical protein
MGLVLGISDYVVVLEFGKVIAHGPPESVRRDPQVVKAYLGSAASELQPAVDASGVGSPEPRDSGAPALPVRERERD